jgi:hypothetical protein
VTESKVALRLYGNGVQPCQLRLADDYDKLASIVRPQPNLILPVSLSWRIDALQKAARVRNIEFSIHRIAKGEEIAAAIDSAQASGATALNIVSSPLFFAHRHLIIDRAATTHDL